MVQQDNGIGSTLKMMIVGSFIMLSVLTWASSPIQFIIEKTTKKLKHKVTVDLCAEIHSKQDLYGSIMRNAWASGCMWQVENYLILMSKSQKERKEFEELFKLGEGPKYEKISGYCEAGASSAMLDNRIQEKIIAVLYLDFDCDKLDKETGEEKHETGN